MQIKVDEVQLPKTVEGVQRQDNAVKDEFYFALDKYKNNGFDEKIHKLYSDITVQGKKLAEHMDIRDLKQYRSLIKDFVNEVVSNAHKFSRDNFLDRRGRHRVYGIVKVIDKNLDSIAQELMKTEKSHIEILGKVDEIRGLLLDIVT